MSLKPELRIDWCSHQAAKYAVEHWHYSKRMPKSKLAKIGVWENEIFVGSVIFGVGATPEISKPFGLKPNEVCELVRVALNTHAYPVSKILKHSIDLVKRTYSRIKVIVSFADLSQGHVGIIYQANNWIYLMSKEYHVYKINGEIVQPRTCYHRYGIGGQSIPWLRTHVDENATRIRNGIKHKYVFPLDKQMREQLLHLAKPYPKRPTSIESDASVIHTGEGGASPTVGLIDI